MMPIAGVPAIRCSGQSRSQFRHGSARIKPAYNPLKWSARFRTMPYAVCRPIVQRITALWFPQSFRRHLSAVTGQAWTGR